MNRDFTLHKFTPAARLVLTDRECQIVSALRVLNDETQQVIAGFAVKLAKVDDCHSDRKTD